MQTAIDIEILHALGPQTPTDIDVRIRGDAELSSCFSVTDLAVSSMRAAATELAAFIDARTVEIDRRLAALWFDMTLRPLDWELPSAWDSIAGVYRASDGWIRLHTNAPHHREAALLVLVCHGAPAAVSKAVRKWTKSELESAIVDAGGAAAAMHSISEWTSHAQGQAIRSEPLIAWQKTGEGGSPAKIERLRVLDLTRVLAGPVATRFLSGFGARVLRIDPPWWSEPGVEPEVTLGKRRAGLDLTKPYDRCAFESLVQEADVLVHGYRPGALEGLGYDQDQLSQLAPHLINVSLSAYGWTGPWATRRGFDSLVQMSCGIADEGMRQKQAEHPVPLPVQALDHATGYLMAAAVMRAVRVRSATGEVLSARLSLARTANLLINSGVWQFRGAPIVESSHDVCPNLERTIWGMAKRIRHPVTLDGMFPQWRYPAGRLRVHPANWW